MPSVRNTFVNPLLTNVSLAYHNDSLIADQLFPTVTVDKETGLYFVVDKENLRAPADAHRGEFSRANRVANNLTTASYTLEEKSLETPISERVMKNYQNPFDPKKNATMLVSEKLALDKEIDLQATIAGSGAPSFDAVSAPWTTAGSDVVSQVRAGKNNIQKNTGHKANTCLLGKNSFDALLKNTAFIASIQYTQTVTEQALRNAIANYFDVDRVLIGDAINNTAKEGQTDVLNYIWTNEVVLAYVAPSAALETPTAGYTLTLNGARYVDEWYEQEIKTTFVRANDFYDSKIIDTNCLYRILNAA